MKKKSNLNTFLRGTTNALRPGKLLRGAKQVIAYVLDYLKPIVASGRLPDLREAVSRLIHRLEGGAAWNGRFDFAGDYRLAALQGRRTQLRGLRIRRHQSSPLAPFPICVQRPYRCPVFKR